MAPRRHAVYELAPGLLLVFKPRGHLETEHRHPHGQRLRVLCGTLVVTLGARTAVLTPRSAPVRIAARRPHATRARSDVWLVAERMGRA
jgi:hypothetical protein